MADTVTPQGIVAVCRQFPTSVRDVLRGTPAPRRDLRGGARPGQRGHDHPGGGCGGGGCASSSPAARVDPYNPKVVRATTGSLFHLPVAVGVDLDDAVERAHAAGAAGARRRRQGRRLPRARARLLAEPTAWLFGNEARGLDDEPLALADLVAPAADLRPCRVAESRDRGERLPVRDARSRSARDLIAYGIPVLLQSGKARGRVWRPRTAAP